MEGKKKGLVVNKERLLKRSTKNKAKTTKKKRSLLIIRGILNYLKSDSYFYSPLLSQLQSPDSSALAREFLSPIPGWETWEPLLKNKGNLAKNMVGYLKSDMYLYAPLDDTQPSDNFAEKVVISPRKGPEQQSNKVTNKFPSKERPLRSKPVAEDLMGEKQGDHYSKGAPGDAILVTPTTPELLEVKKTVICRSYHTRLSTSSGN